MYIDGTNLIYSYKNTQNAQKYMTNGQFYEGYIDYYEGSGAAHIILSWSYSSQSNIVIPASSLYSPVYINSPKQLSISCPSGLVKDRINGRPFCKEVWGNGVRTNTEEWDDGNIENKDGWTSNCLIENTRLENNRILPMIFAQKI